MYSAHRYRLVGHTYSRGSATYNQDLSERRAQSVRAFVLDHQQALRGSLEAQGEGESRLLSPDDTGQAHALNQRVEVRGVVSGKTSIAGILRLEETF